jgi:hypothetical protein
MPRGMFVLAVALSAPAVSSESGEFQIHPRSQDIADQ